MPMKFFPVYAQPGYVANTRSLSLQSSPKNAVRTPANGTSRKKMTFSFWYKSTAGDNQNVPFGVGFLTDYITVNTQVGAGGVIAIVLNGGTDGLVQTNAMAGVINNGAWHNVVIWIDTANPTAADRGIIYVDGVRAAVTTTTTITQNYNTFWNSTAGFEEEVVQTVVAGAASLYDELAKIDGDLLSPGAFAYNGEPLNLAGRNFGLEGFWLRFETGVAATVGTDSSGNGLNFTNAGFVDGDFSTTVP